MIAIVALMIAYRARLNEKRREASKEEDNTDLGDNLNDREMNGEEEE